MAENINDGNITIGDGERLTPILVSTLNIIQTPIFDFHTTARIMVSKHGDTSKSWIKLEQNSLIKIETPFYIMCKHACVIPAM